MKNLLVSFAFLKKNLEKQDKKNFRFFTRLHTLVRIIIYYVIYVIILQPLFMLLFYNTIYY